MKLLVLTHASSIDEVLPGLALLGHHRTTLVPPAMPDFLAAADRAEIVLVDGRVRPVHACELAATTRRARPALPAVGVVGPDAVMHVGDDCALVQLVLSTAGPAEIDARLRLAARRPERAATVASDAVGTVSTPSTGAPTPEPLPVPTGSELVVGDLVVDAASWSARVGARHLRLARREFELLCELATHAGRPLSRRHLLARVWGSDYEGSARTVDVHVRQLRRILGARHREMIRTVRGTGYVMMRTPATEPASAPTPTASSYALVSRVATPIRPEHALRGPSRPGRPGGLDTPADVVASKRAGLPLDLEALAAAGTIGALERYSLKTVGACSQSQDELFLVRARTHAALSSAAARELAALAREYDHRWVHLTTRQQVELHHVAAREVPGVLTRMRAAGIDTASTCGHTVRGITSCPEAGVSPEEPFDCGPDARALTESLLGLGPDLNTRLPQRFNVTFGGCPDCRDHAKVSDVGLVSTLAADGRPGYELWVGGSLGKSSPTLATRVVEFLPRHRVLPAVHAVLEVFLSHGAFDRPNKARLKFLVSRIGIDRFVDLFTEAYTAARRQEWPAPATLADPPGAVDPDPGETLARAPEGGFGAGVRPQRTPGLATVTVTVPLGDLDADDLDVLADAADIFADGTLRPTRDQNLVLRDVPTERVTALRAWLAAIGLQVHGFAPSQDVRACTGSPVCALALTPTQGLAQRLWRLPALRRNSGLRVSISGCPASCAQHQAADLGLAGNRVTIGGEQVVGYRVYLGGDLRRDRLGQVLGRIAGTDVETVTELVVGTWERDRRGGETLADTVARTGPAPFMAALHAHEGLAWEPGDESAEPGPASAPGR